MRLGIVEGEPGIFPDPIARLLRRLGRLFGTRRVGERPPEAKPTDEEPTEPDH